MRADVIHDVHDHSLSGHLGLKRTYAKIQEKYFWFDMYADIKEWLRLCSVCGSKKGKIDERMGIAHSHIAASKPFEVMGMDIIGPLPTTVHGYRWILVFTDHFSKWAEAFPMKDSTAPTIAKHYVEDIICRHGAPKRILSDRGNNLIGEVLTEVNRLMGSVSIRTSPYHPQTNGLTERFNKTLCTMLSMFCSKHQRDWDEPLPYVLFNFLGSMNTQFLIPDHPSVQSVGTNSSAMQLFI